MAGDAYEFERFSRRRRIRLFGQDAWIAAPEDVLLHKLRWHRISPTGRQITDARGIYTVSGDQLDFDYLHRWAREIGVDDLLQRVIQPLHGNDR